MPFDETEAYLRHRARVHEREKREKLRKEGKLEAYLAEIERNKPKIEKDKTSNGGGEETDVNIDKIMEAYYAIKKLDIENAVQSNQIRIEIPPEVNVDANNKQKKKARKHRKKKKKNVVEEENVVLDEAEFKPTMAGSTGLPTFFFSNLVKENRSVFARYRVTCRQKKN